MPRYQFLPHARVTHIELDRARKAARDHGGKNVREAFPMMGDSHSPKWRGTNQPRTITFTARHDDDARHIGDVYGSEDAFIWNITEQHYA